MNLELSNRRAVVTGARKGIGLAETQALVQEGAGVLAGARTVLAGARTVASFANLQGTTSVALDLVAPDGPDPLVRTALKQHGPIDILVNNVGAVRPRLEGFLGSSDEEFEWSM
jgi:NAD(P)-dependent dehydrogenase (short-subunit alcohol dehydrogenase family)